jgi:DNA-binding NarL/FixJ family response regulator
MQSHVTVLCVEDHNLVRECVVAIIDRDPCLRVTAQARTIKDAIDRFIEVRPDVTLVSLRPRGLDCLETIRAIRRVDPGAQIVVYARDESGAVYLALEAGAAAFVVASATSADLVGTIIAVHNGHGPLLDEIRSKRESRGGLPTLTTREIEILELLTQGLRTKAIAATLRISDHTVKVHMKRVYEKLGVHGRAAALAEALRRGFVRLASGRQVAATKRRPRQSPQRPQTVTLARNGEHPLRTIRDASSTLTIPTAKPAIMSGIQ